MSLAVVTWLVTDAAASVGVRRLDHALVGDHVLDADWGIPYLRDYAFEELFGIGVHAKVGALAFDHASDVRFADVGVDLHLSQILCDDEEGWRLKRRGDRLPDIHVAGHYDAVHRRIDGGIA